MSDDIKPLNTSEVSQYLHDKHNIKRTKKTLEKDRYLGIGPEWFYVGPIPYAWPAWVDAWVLARTTDKVRSAAEGRQARREQNQNLRKANPSKSKPRKPAQKDSDDRKPK
jgi:hypothetical protein